MLFLTLAAPMESAIIRIFRTKTVKNPLTHF